MNVTNATNFLFDLGMESGMERPQYIIVGFENNNVNEQTHDANTFDIMNVTECYCKIDSELSIYIGFILVVDVILSHHSRLDIYLIYIILIINVCYVLWCLIAYLHPAKDHPNRVSKYKKPEFFLR